MAPVPVGNAAGGAAFVFDNKIHHFHTGAKSVYVYDEMANKWERKGGHLPGDFNSYTRVVLVDDSVIDC